MKLLFITILLFPIALFAGKYGEHREIGNRGFNLAMQKLISSHAFGDSLDVLKFFQENLGIFYDTIAKKYVINSVTFPPNLIAYGELTGLSGDHSTDPLSLEESLRYEFSKVNKIVRMHDKAKEDFGVAADDVDLFNIDFTYGLLAVVDESHFYDYGRSFDEQIMDVDKNHIQLLELPKNVERVFSELEKTNSIAKYITLHSVAIDFAGYAGYYFYKDIGRSNKMLHYALLYSAFADHYLQDAFAAGHLAVHRTIFGAVIDNKQIHDFYNEAGLQVFNLRGDEWISFGDGRMDQGTKDWREHDTYDDLPSDNFTINYRLAIEATKISVEEVFTSYIKARSGDEISFFESIPKYNSEYQKFFLDNFEALSIIPVPYNSNLDDYDFDPLELSSLKKQNKVIPNRSHMVPRVANAFALIYGWNVFTSNGGMKLGLRFHTNKWYSYDNLYHKKGSIDQWFEYNLSFLISNTERGEKIDTYQYLAGIGYKLDWWVSSSRFVGMLLFIDMGLQHKTEVGDNFMVSPKLGIDVAPMLGIDYAELPWWIGVPLNILLPFQLTIQADYVWNQEPVYYITRVVDLVY